MRNEWKERENMERVTAVKTAIGIFALAVISACATAAHDTRQIPVQKVAGTENDSKQAEKIQEILSNTVKNMEASGDEKVNVFVDEKEDVVQDGNYVRVSIRATLQKDGTPIQLFPVEKTIRRDSYLISGENGKSRETSEEVLLSGNKNSMGGLGGHIIGLRNGEKKHIILKPEEAFGEKKEGNTNTYPRTREMALRTEMPPEEYFKNYKSFPVAGRMIDYNPYVKARIEKVAEKEVTLVLEAKEGKRIDSPFGEAVIAVNEEDGKLYITLNPIKGTVFRGGIITDVQDDKFAVDYNHPLAGETIDIDLTIKQIVKPSTFGNNKVAWLEDYGDALQLSQENHKPLVLLLYADWCEWCKKMLGGTFEDPWVRYFRDEYIWVKVNSDKDRSLYEEFGQNGFPMTVLIDPERDVNKKLDGYKKPDEMRRELLEFRNRVRNAS